MNLTLADWSNIATWFRALATSYGPAGGGPQPGDIEYIGYDSFQPIIHTIGVYIGYALAATIGLAIAIYTIRRAYHTLHWLTTPKQHHPKDPPP
jgi:hypothetical protein